MDKIPFTSYDFWGYLSAGFLLLIVVDQIAGTNTLTRDSWTVVEGIIAVSAAYAVGHLAASGSSLVFERIVVGKLLGKPQEILFAKTTKVCRCWRIAFWTYFERIPKELQEAALKKGHAHKINEAGEALFQAAHAHALDKTAVSERLANFLNLYGFCRNTAFVALVDAVLLGMWWWRGSADAALRSAADTGLRPADAGYWAIAALVLAAGLFYRYLKFFRLYAVEVFKAYAYL